MHGVKRSLWLLRGVGVLGVLMAIAGCTGDGEEVPTSTVPNQNLPTETTSADITEIAQSFYDCMKAEGLPVELVKNNDGELGVVEFSGDHWIMTLSPEGGDVRWSTTHPENDPVSRQQAQTFFDESVVPGLMIDGEDYSTVFSQCLERSGYDDHQAWGSTHMDTTAIENQVLANNTWAGCARDDGWPMIKDSVLPTNPDWNDWPMVLIPLTISVEELSTLLDACPSFDPAKQDYINDWWNTQSTGHLPPDFIPDPVLDFYTPSTENNPDTTPNAEEQAGAANLPALYEVLNEKSSEYWERKIGSTPI